MRWLRFKNESAAEMYRIVSEKVFPFVKNLQSEREDSTYSHHMKDARFTIPTPVLLAKVVDMIDKIPMEERDIKGDLYEYMLGKIASAGQNGQFRTPRHIIKMMVEMVAPTPERAEDLLCKSPRALRLWIINPNSSVFSFFTFSFLLSPYVDLSIPAKLRMRFSPHLSVRISRVTPRSPSPSARRASL